MLERARGEPARFDADFLAAPAPAFDHHRLVARHLAHPARVAEAPLVPDLHAVVLDDLGVDERPDLVVVTFHHAHTQRDSDLWRGQAGARRGQHRLDEVVDQPLYGRVDTSHSLRFFAQDGLIEVEDGSDGHEFDSTQALLIRSRAAAQVVGSTSKLQPRPRGARWRARSSPEPFSVTCQRYSPRRR